MRILQSLSYTGYWTYPLILQTHIWRLLGIYIVCIVAFKYGGYKFNIYSDYQVGFATSAYCSPRLLHFPNVSHMIKSLSLQKFYRQSTIQRNLTDTVFAKMANWAKLLIMIHGGRLGTAHNNNVNILQRRINQIKHTHQLCECPGAQTPQITPINVAHFRQSFGLLYYLEGLGHRLKKNIYSFTVQSLLH